MASDHRQRNRWLDELDRSKWGAISIVPTSSGSGARTDTPSCKESIAGYINDDDVSNDGRLGNNPRRRGEIRSHQQFEQGLVAVLDPALHYMQCAAGVVGTLCRRGASEPSKPPQRRNHLWVQSKRGISSPIWYRRPASQNIKPKPAR